MTTQLHDEAWGASRIFRRGSGRAGGVGVTLACLLTCAPAVGGAAGSGDERVVAAVTEEFALGEYVITGTRTRQAAEASPVRVEVAVATEFTRLGARSFADAMEYLPGVQVESNCQSCNTTELRLLGLGGAYNQVAFDGLPMLSSLAGVYGLEQVPAAFVDRIEVVKGGGSSLYGAGAVAGVVNIISRRPAASGVVLDHRFDAVRGKHAHQAAVVLSHVSRDALSELAGYAQVQRADAVDLNGDGYSELARRRLEVGGARGRWRRGDAVWTIDLNHLREDRRGGNAFDRRPHLANIAEALDTRRSAATVVLEHQPASALDYRVVVAAAWTRRSSYYGGLGDVATDPADPGFDPIAYDDALAAARTLYGRTRNPLYVAEMQMNHRLDRRTISWGVQVEHEQVRDLHVDDAGVPGERPALAGTFSNGALFLQDDWRPAEAWTLLTGARVDRNNQLDSAIVSPRVALRFAPVRTLSLRASVGSGFRAPRIFDEDLHVETLGATPIAIVNASGLRRERALTASLGVVWNPPPLADRLAFEATVFGAWLRDAFQLSEVRAADDGALHRVRFNAGGAGVRGVEVSGAWSFSPRLRLDAGVVLQRARRDAPEVIFDNGSGARIVTDRFNKTPGRHAVVTLQYENAEAFDASLAVRHTGPMHVLDNNAGTFARVPAFTVVDVSIGRHVRVLGSECLLQVGVRNVTDTRQRDLQSGPGRDSDYVYGPRAPRTVFLAMRLGW